MTPTTPDEAREALAAVDRRRVDAVDAAYATPWWYFAAIGGLLLVLGGVQLADDWIEGNWGETASVLVVVGSGLVICAGLGLSIGLVARQVRATPAPGTAPTNRDMQVLAIACGVLVLAVFGISWALTGRGDHAVALAAMALGVITVVGGIPLRNTLRRRARARVRQG